MLEVMSPVSFRIEFDWSRVISVAQTLIEKSRDSASEIVPYGNTTFYHLGPLGSVGHHHISNNWHFTSGKWLYKQVPWLKQFEEDLAELTPSSAISIMNGDGGKHVDYPNLPTALNYPINTTQAQTYVIVGDKEFTYPSIAHQPWILTTQYPHGVRNTELRYVFNVHFEQPYEVVKRWFADHPNLIYK